MTRKILDNSRIDPAIENRIGGDIEFSRTIEEVERAIDQHNVVIVGMDQNPFPKKARKLLDARGISYFYIGYGSYFSEWKRRGVLKMWSGWQTFPMVFVQGKLIGGFTDLEKMLKSGGLKQ